MSQDTVADALNQIMNAKRVEKKNVTIKKYSKVLLNLLEMMKEEGHIEYKVDEENKTATITIIKLNECKAIKPRYNANVTDIDKYLRRFLPSRNFGQLILTTNKGLLRHKEAIEKNIGGSVLAYYY
jgi:small subunit ribosomal protein S8